MNRNDKSKYLLYIEPSKDLKSKAPVLDEWTRLMEYALGKATQGTGHYSNLEDTGDGYDWKFPNGTTRRIPSFNEGSAYRGTHHTDCGEVSSNIDYKLENGLITNSLAPFYLKYYRTSISDNDMAKLKELKEFYKDQLGNISSNEE